jgi:chlorobactene glucosyltransferase
MFSLPIAGGNLKLLLSSGWIVCVVWLLVRAFNQRGLLEKLGTAPVPDAAAKLAVIVPTRDEESNIGACLQALVAQEYSAARLTIIVVDDHSADATVSRAEKVSLRHPHVAVIRSPPLPAHWIGKSHACWIGAGAASGDTQWLCFIDADVRVEPKLMASAIAAASHKQLDLLSLAPRQELRSFAERLVIPCGLYLLGFRQDLRQVQSPSSSDATATGQFMLFRASAYRAAGGHAAVRGAVCEDLELARLFKRSGLKVLLLDGHRMLSTRMYTGWETLWPGIAKNLTEMLGGPIATVGIALAAITLAWAAVLVPLADAVGCVRGSAADCIALVPAVVASAAAFALHIAGAAYFTIPLWYGLLFPLGYSAGALLAIDSLRRRLRRRITWKGRTYP